MSDYDPIRRPNKPDVPSAFAPVYEPPPTVLPEEPEEATVPGVEKQLLDRYPELTRAEVKRLRPLPPGTELEQGAVYFDLRHPEMGPFKALGGQVVGEDELIIAKRSTDYEIWNRIVAEDRGTPTDPEIERPEREEHAVRNQAELND